MAPSAKKSFTAVLESLQAGSGWVIVRIPFDVAQTWPVRSRLRMRGEVRSANSKSKSSTSESAFAFRTSLFPAMTGKGHFMVVNKKMQTAARASVGSKVKIWLEPDLEERVAVVPAELAAALKGDRRLRRWFDALNPSRRKDICGWVGQPKSAASRHNRAARIAEWLLLTLEGEIDPPPLLKAAFQRQPQARDGWLAMTPVQRRNHLLGIFHYQTAESRERRAAKAVEEALALARKWSGGGE